MQKDDDEQNTIRQLGVFLTIPFALGLPPIVGWYIGSWLDEEFHTQPYLMFLFIAFGFAAGFREVYRIINRFGNGN